MSSMRLLVPLMALALALPLPSSADQPIVCGATITASITLTADLHCSGTALMLGTPISEPRPELHEITVDLNGFTVSSDLSEPCSNESSCGTIEIGRNTIAGGITVRNGRVSHTGANGYAIVVDQYGSGGTFDKLVVEGGGLSCHNRGVAVDRCSFVRAGIVSDYCGARITNSTFSNYDPAIVVSNAYGTLVSENVITGGGVVNRSLNYFPWELSNNQIRSAFHDGIRIDNIGGSGVQVRNNVVVGSGGAGIRKTYGSAATLTSNLVLDNTELGIDAPNAIDGGGNLAGGNGDPLQCVGVVCSTELSSDLAMCIDERTQLEAALGQCNATVIGTNGDFNGDGLADVVDIAIFRRWVAGYRVP